MYGLKLPAADGCFNFKVSSLVVRKCFRDLGGKCQGKSWEARMLGGLEARKRDMKSDEGRGNRMIINRYRR